MVMMAEDINQAGAHIFTNMRDKGGWSIEEKFAYNMETLRIHREGGDTSKRWLFMMYFGTTYRRWQQVSCWLSPTVVWMLSPCVRAWN